MKLRLALAAIALFALESSALAQAVSARLEGFVQDPSRAVVPGVTVAAVNEGTGIRTQVTSNDAGRYVFPNLPPGTYTISAEYTGFKKVVVAGVQLQIGDSRTLDLLLAPGEVTESVNVSAEAALVNTTTAKLGAVVQNRQAVDLPLNGRDAMMLFYLQAGTNPIDRFASQQQNGIVDGLGPHTSSIKVEGIMSSNPGFDYAPSRPSTPVPQEAVGEYRITTSGDSADAGRGSGAQVKVFIKSGTNQFRGSVFEFNRNTAYNANNFFANKTGQQRPVLRRHQFGFALGGPIIRNRTFFFTTAEWQRQNSESIENRFVYTTPLRQGTFRYVRGGANSAAAVDAQGNPVNPGNIATIDLKSVDPSRTGLDTVFLPKILAQMPAPNNFDIGDGLNLAGYRYASPLPFNYNSFLVKFDHSLSSKHQLAFSMSRQTEDQPQARLYNGVSPEGFTELRRGVSLRAISSFTPRLTNELSVGANDRTSFRPITNEDQLSPRGNFQLTGLGTTSGLTGTSNGNIHIVRGLQRQPAVNLGFSDNMTAVLGNHTLTFGGEYWYQTLNSRSGTSEFPVLRTTNADNPANVPAITGLNANDRLRAQQLVNDLTGSIGSVTQSFYLTDKAGYTPFVNNYQQFRKREYAFYVGDIWKVRRNFSLNLGLRWEHFPPVYIASGIYGYPVGGVDGALGIQGPTRQPTRWGFADNQGKNIFETDRNNFGPTVGFAWDPFGKGKTSIRSSYRIAFDRFMIVTGNFSGRNYGTTTTVVLNPLTRFSDPRLYSSILPIPVPKPFEDLPNIRTGRAYVADPKLAVPYTQLWGFGIEHEVFRNWKLDVNYVGNHAVGMWRGQDLNQVEIRNNGFLQAFQVAQRNLAATGNFLNGESLGALAPLFRLVPTSQNTVIQQGQAAALANFIDTTTLLTGRRGGLLERAGLSDNFFRLNTQVDDLTIAGNRSHSTWNALKLGLTKRLDKGMYFQFNYTFSRGFTDAIPEQDLGLDYRDNANMRLDKSLNPLNSTHVVQANGIWELPFGKGKWLGNQAGGLLNALIGGWQVNGLYNFASGRPLAFSTGRFNLSQTVASTPDFAGDFSSLSGIARGNQILFLTPAEVAAFRNPAAGSTGGMPRNSRFMGPSFFTLDASVFKQFSLAPIREGMALQFRAEFFNVLNQVAFQAPPATNLNINSGSFGQLNAAYPARIGQFALKLTF